ncbi:alpha/beta hydrolase-fold protein [Fontivita pretiosa]|uniref:alpha/beta hydrolase-fold protein n=1 Tax=Fontivita pretiosa TaxID=2989684 RepID=UPI003D17B4BE
MRYHRFVLALLLTLANGRWLVAQPAPPSTQPIPTSQPIPRQQLDQMYRAELGQLYNPADADKLYQANLLLERYFAAPDQRRAVVQSLQALGLDANLIGRLARIRMTWPPLAPGVYYVNERMGPHDVRYFFGIPRGYDRTRPWPLVIKLPTADAFLTEPRPDPIQVAQIYTAWMSDELSRHPDAVVIMPLLNLDELWGPSYVGMNSVIQPMHHLAGRVNIDPARVYLLGHSMSAHAAWNLALHYSTYFASFTSLAGGVGADWQRLRLMNLRNILPVMWHDADDPVVKVDLSRQLANILRNNLGIEIDYQETRNVGHTPTDAIAEAAYAKMRGRVRDLYPRRVSIQSNRPDTMFNRVDWVQIYQPLRPGEERRLYFRRGSGHMLVYPAAFSVDATLDGDNRIVATSQNVESMRFYINDQMIDFSRPVIVTVNRKPRFEGMVRPDIEQMLKDQLFLGRGWRYYTGVIDIDFGAAPAAPATRGRATTGQP